MNKTVRNWAQIWMIPIVLVTEDQIDEGVSRGLGVAGWHVTDAVAAASPGDDATIWICPASRVA